MKKGWIEETFSQEPGEERRRLYQLTREGREALLGEIERLKKEEERLKGELKRSRSMLSNEKFTSKAPKEKVEEEQNKLLMYEEMMKKVVEQLKELEG